MGGVSETMDVCRSLGDDQLKAENEYQTIARPLKISACVCWGRGSSESIDLSIC